MVVKKPENEPPRGKPRGIKQRSFANARQAAGN
jgi:hypothetical protein